MNKRRIELARRRFRFYLIMGILFMVLTVKTFEHVSLKREYVKAKAEMQEELEEVKREYETVYITRETFKKGEYKEDSLFVVQGYPFKITLLEDAPEGTILVKKRDMGREFYLDIDYFR